MGNRHERRAEKSRQRKAGYESESLKTLLRTVDSMRMGKDKSPDAVAASPCGHCGKVLDGATSSDGVNAKPGDITVCIYCAGASTFGVDMQLVAMTEDEVQSHEHSEPIRANQELLRAYLAQSAMGGRKERHEA